MRRWCDGERGACLLQVMRKGKCGAWAFCQNETSFERNEWGFAQKLGGFYGQRRREGRDEAEGEIKGVD